jgi:hypothetical protein
VTYKDAGGEQGCRIDETVMPSEAWRAYTLAMVCMQYVVPLIIISATYGHMAKVR